MSDIILKTGSGAPSTTTTGRPLFDPTAGILYIGNAAGDGNFTFVASGAGLTFVGDVTGNISGSAATFTSNLTGDVTSTGMATTLAANLKTGTITLTIDGGGVAPSTGVKGYWTCPFACTISAWYITADAAGACVVDVWKAAGAIPTNDNTITNGHEPLLASTNQIGNDTDLSDWTTQAVAAGDVLGFNLDSVTTCARITLVLKVVKT